MFVAVEHKKVQAEEQKNKNVKGYPEDYAIVIHSVEASCSAKSIRGVNVKILQHMKIESMKLTHCCTV
jgi:hypothetical protein